METFVMVYIILAICTFPIWAYATKIVYKKHDMKADFRAVSIILVCTILFPVALLAGAILLFIDGE